MAHDMKERRNMETPEQTECRRNKMAHQSKERLNMETSEQTECRRMKMAHDSIIIITQGLLIKVRVALLRRLQ